MMKGLGLFTSKIHHHASFSGYEQLIDYVQAEHVNAILRTENKSLVKRLITKLLRSTVTISNWYQWQDLVAEWDAFRYIRRNKKARPIVHLLYGDSMLGWLPQLKRWYDFSLITTVHACPSDMERIYGRTQYLDRVDRFIILAPNQRAGLEALGVPKENIVLIPHGLDHHTISSINSEDSELGARNRGEDRTFRVLGVGNWRRDFKVYNKIFKRFQDSEHIHFDMVVPAFRRDELIDQENVTIRSGISDEALIELYEHSDLLLMAVEDAAANNVILESMAHGLPILGTDHPALTWYAGEAMQPFTEVDDAVKAIQEFQSNPDRLANMARFGLKRAEEFDWNTIGSQLTTLYKQLTHS
jgi:glycosyltransferase involved in cell wall biosynthesis